MRITAAIDVHAAPEVVFEYLKRPDRAMEWMTSVSRTEILDQTPDMVGTTFREFVEENGRGTELRGRISAYRPNERIAFDLSGQFNTVHVEFRLEKARGGTRLTEEASVRFKSFLRVLSPLLKRKIVAQTRRELATLKGLCEQATVGT